jgi:hypothetical protein
MNFLFFVLYSMCSAAVSQVRFFNNLNATDVVADLFTGVGNSTSNSTSNITIPVRLQRGSGGSISAMNIENMPALLGQGMGITCIFLEPCAINLPHTHPRATEGLFVIEGEDILMGFVLENGGKVFNNVLRVGMATFFPRGSIHFEINRSCKRAILLPVFNSEDPGVQTTLTNLLFNEDDVLSVTTRLSKIELNILKNNVEASPTKGTTECLKKCGLA